MHYFGIFEGLQTLLNCPLQGQSLQKGLIYKASINSGTEEKTYIGQAGNTFKERFANHKSTFKSKKYEKVYLENEGERNGI